MTNKNNEITIDSLFNLIKKYYIKIIITNLITFPLFFFLFFNFNGHYYNAKINFDLTNDAYQIKNEHENFINFIENLSGHKFKLKIIDETISKIIFDTLTGNLNSNNINSNDLNVDSSSVRTKVSEFFKISYTYSFRFNTNNLNDARTIIKNTIDSSLIEINKKFQNSILIWDLSFIKNNLELTFENNLNFSKRNDEYLTNIYKSKIKEIDKQLAKIYENNNEIKNFNTSNCNPMSYGPFKNDFDFNSAIDFSNLIDLYCTLNLLKIKNEFLLSYNSSDNGNVMELQRLFKINYAKDLIENKIKDYKNIHNKNFDTINITSSIYNYQYFESYVIFIILYFIFILFYFSYLFLYDSRRIKKL